MLVRTQEATASIPRFGMTTTAQVETPSGYAPDQEPDHRGHRAHRACRGCADPVAAPATPAASAAAPSGFELTFQAPETRQWTIDPGSAAVRMPSALALNSSPAIAALSTGGYKMAFVASDGALWHVDPGGGGRAAPIPRVADHTSPAIVR